jgi:CheY-like chemotaxis protein
VDAERTPFSGDSAGGPCPAGDGGRARSPGLLALVVDDEPPVREMLARLLGSAGFRCIQASSAEEAFELLDGREPSLGVFDIAMPGVSGAELAWRVKQHRQGLPLVAVSGQLDDWDPEDLADLGFARVFPKPLDCVEFIEACRNLCGGRPADGR